jgi:ribonuclease HII
MRWSTIERDLRVQHGPLLAGVDEVGRGPLAGPVVACAVVMPADKRAIIGVNDSKQLSAKKREELVLKIRERAIAIGIGAASVREIDRHNIYQASVLAIKRALKRLPMKPDHIVVDGKRINSLMMPHTAVVRGDARCFSVACASIIAKVTRDRVMAALAERYPGYKWEANMGYATKSHLGGIVEVGITRHHRRSFLPVRQLSLNFDSEVPFVPLIDGDEAPTTVAEALDAVALSKLIEDAPIDPNWTAEGPAAP